MFEAVNSSCLMLWNSLSRRCWAFVDSLAVTSVERSTCDHARSLSSSYRSAMVARTQLVRCAPFGFVLRSVDERSAKVAPSRPV